LTSQLALQPPKTPTSHLKQMSVRSHT
jgi:hypothetical protein